MAGVLHLVDGNSYAYRSFYGMPPLSTRSGRPTQAVMGFSLFLLKLLKEHPHDAVVVAFDPKGRTFRHEVFEKYKAHRKPMPDDLVSQIPLIHEVTRLLGVPSFAIKGFEADDVIATIAARTVRAGGRVVVYSGDKDILQLVGPRVTVAIPRHEDEPMDSAAVKEKWGVPPERMTDLLALMGDASDNLPGVMGVGEKTAARLVDRFGPVERLYERLDEAGTPKLREKLAAAQAQVLATRELARLRTDVPVGEELERRPPDQGGLRALFEELEFHRLMSSLPGEGRPGDGGGGASATAGSRPAGPLPEMLSNARALVVAAPEMSGRGRMLLVPQEEGGPLLALSCGGRRLAVPAGEAARAREFWKANAVSWDVFDLKSVLRGAAPEGLEPPGSWSDPMLSAIVVRGRGGRMTVREAARDFTGRPTGEEEGSPEKTAGADLDALEALVPVLEGEVAKEEAGRLLRELELPLVPVLARMEAFGVRLDAGALEEAGREIKGRLKAIERELKAAVGDGFNLLSPRQVATVLFEKLKLPAKRRTKTGFSTDEGVLEELAVLSPVPGLILEYRRLSKLLGTYLEPLPGFCDRDGLLHTSFSQIGAATGRISSSDPNLQNIPIRGETGLRIRRAFVPRAQGLLLLSADYSQIELRILANLAGDRAFLEAFRNGEDIHSATAAEMFGKTPLEVTPDERRAAKAVNFGIVYGMTRFGLSRELKCDAATAGKYLDRWMERHAAVRRYWDGVLSGVRAKGWAATMFGRRRRFPEINSANRMRREEAEREAINHPIQGTAADILKLAMVRVAREVPEARLILTVHDELLFEVPAGEAAALTRRVRRAMEAAGGLPVPLLVEAATGKNWAECHP